MADLKLEAGKCYRTRDGRKASLEEVKTVSRVEYEHTEALGSIRGDRRWVSWDGFGRLYGCQKSGSDLVEEWREPIEAWLLMPNNGFSNSIHPTKRDAEKALKTLRGFSSSAPGARIIHVVEKEDA